MPAPRLAVLSAALLAACTLLSSCAKEELPWEFSGCDPLDPSMCALPFPSSVQLTPDEGAQTGWRVNFDGQDFPRPDNGALPGPVLVERARWVFGGHAPSWPASVRWTCPTCPVRTALAATPTRTSAASLLDLDTGERVPHWVEVDAHAQDPDQRLTVLWPAQQLAFDHTYVVAFRGLTTEDGSAVAASDAFVALRDKDKTEDPDIENRRAHYDDVIFPALEEAGFARDEVVLAWSAHTASEASTPAAGCCPCATRRMPCTATAPPTCAGTRSRPSTAARRASASTRACAAASTPRCSPRILAWTPCSTGTRTACPSRTAPARPSSWCRSPARWPPSRVPPRSIQYGHGLLGDEGEARSGWLEKFADDNRFIVIAGRQTGMCVEDYAAIGIMMSRDLSGFPTVPERLHQGIVENLLLTRIITRTLPADDEMAVDGTALLSGSNDDVAWYGISQGAIVGGAIVGASPDIQRAVISVGGGPTRCCCHARSTSRASLSSCAAASPDERDQMFLIHGLLIQLWDVGESAAWVDTLRDKQVLSQVGIGDAQVHLEGSRWQARSAGLSLIQDPVSDVFGLDTQSTPYVGSGYVEVDYGVPVGPDVNLPPDKSTDTHECVRRSPSCRSRWSTSSTPARSTTSVTVPASTSGPVAAGEDRAAGHPRGVHRCPALGRAGHTAPVPARGRGSRGGASPTRWVSLRRDPGGRPGRGPPPGGVYQGLLPGRPRRSHCGAPGGVPGAGRWGAPRAHRGHA